MKVGVVSLGCPKNLTDSEIMLGLLADNAHQIVTDVSEAEIIIVNTCAFIDDAKQESIDTILEMAEHKKDKCKKLIVCGCLAERYHNEIITELPEVDAICGAGDFPKICEIIDDVMADKFPNLHGNQNCPIPENLPRIISTPQYTAYLKIADGCDNNCTYCAIPQIRGHYKSRQMEDVISEAKSLADSGVTELIVIAQDTTRYGMDLYGEYKLAELLSELCKIEKLHWIRLHYLYPEAITDELIDTIAKEKKICNYFDMPIQHISDDVLKRMGRKTTGEEICDKIHKIRNKIPDAVIRTSLIAGFPGETETDHNLLREFLTAEKLDRVGIFAYSQEENTPAARLPGQLDEFVKITRRDELMKLQNDISFEKNKAKLNTVVEVLCEGYDEENYMYYGRSYADSIDIDSTVYFATKDEVLPGEYKTVKILNCDEYDLIGEEV